MPKYDILSPDGFAMHPTDTYTTKKAAFEFFVTWSFQYKKHQGYYSSVNFGRIPADNLKYYCRFVRITRNGQEPLEKVSDYIDKHKLHN